MAGKHGRWSGPADIAWCDEHGLHGARDRCFDCRKPVEQIRMLPLDELLERIKADLHSDEDGTTRLAGALGDAIAEEAGSCSLEFVEPEQLALGICNWLKDFGPREDEDGEGVKPADPSDGAGNGARPARKQGSAPARRSATASATPDAGEQGGAESSRVGGPSKRRACRECGCTDTRACRRRITEPIRRAMGETERRCHWVEPDLCSACAPGAERGWQHPVQEATS